MSKSKRVVIVHASDSSMDQIMAGIDEVRRSGHEWYVRHQYNVPRNAEEVADVLGFQPDGLISVGGNLPQSLQHQAFPWVSVRNRQSPLAVVCDDHAVGECAADHLVGLGAATFAYLRDRNDDSDDSGWKRARREGFQAGLAKHGQTAHLLAWNHATGATLSHAHFLAQIAALPKPIAIFTGNDWYALEALEALFSAGVRIPAEVALLGADDVQRCAVAAVPLSSVRVPHRECGRRAAELLVLAMDGKTRGTVAINLPPDGVAERASTDAIEVRDREVAAVLRLIRMRVAEPFDVGDVIAASNLGRRSLELRFRRLLGRTILDEIHRCRIEHAKSMLRNPEMTIAQVASSSGFSDAPHFTVVFRKVAGVTPSVWRAENRVQTGA
jgi:LacI family transcriptional regulator